MPGQGSKGPLGAGIHRPILLDRKLWLGEDTRACSAAPGEARGSGQQSASWHSVFCCRNAGVASGPSFLDIRWGFSGEETRTQPWRAVTANWELFRSRLDGKKEAMEDWEPPQSVEQSPGPWSGRVKGTKGHLGGGLKLAATQESQYESLAMVVASRGAVTSGERGRGRTEGCSEADSL